MIWVPSRSESRQLLDLPELLQAGVRDSSVAQVEIRQVLELLQLFQAGSRDLRYPPRLSVVRCLKLSDLLQAGIRDLGAVEVERSQILEPLEIIQTAICDFRIGKVDPQQVRILPKLIQGRIGDVRVRQ